MAALSTRKCVPCEGNVPPLTPEEAAAFLAEVNEQAREGDEWLLVDGGHLLARTFHFKNFVEAMKFVNAVAALAEEEGHHPDLSISYDTVGVELTTHAIAGLSENDFILASKINQV